MPGSAAFLKLPLLATGRHGWVVTLLRQPQAASRGCARSAQPKTIAEPTSQRRLRNPESSFLIPTCTASRFRKNADGPGASLLPGPGAEDVSPRGLAPPDLNAAYEGKMPEPERARRPEPLDLKKWLSRPANTTPESGVEIFDTGHAG
jgi:hypothetical protein